MIIPKENMVTNRDYYSQMLTTRCMKLFDDFSKNKEIKNLSDYFAKSKYYDDSNQLAVSKMTD